MLGIENPYVNGGIVDSWGLEAGADYTKKVGDDLLLNAGAKFTLAKNKIVEEYETPRAYKYQERTGLPLGQIFGLQAIGYFTDQADIDHNPTQQFSEVRPGDIKYKDQNGDNVINADDEVKMGCLLYTSPSPRDA